MATDTLFEQHTIKEIQDIEKNLRNDIEKKKEELRQMVGERYRDLMEAADTITEMQHIAENVTYRIRGMETNCANLEDSNLKSGLINVVKLKVAQRKKKNVNVYIVASLIKVLMDAPAKIWGFIEEEDYLSAFQLYALARHTHSLLVLDPVYRKQGILMHFPIINKQWTSMRHFQHILLQKSREALLSGNICVGTIVGPLCCILFLSDTSLEQLLEETLNNRKVVLMNIFRPEKSAKVQVCQLVEVLQNALHFIYAIFYPGDSKNGKTNLFEEAMRTITDINSTGSVPLLDLNSPTFHHLPKEISAYRPSLKTPFRNMTVEHLQAVCNKWIRDISIETQSKLKDLLNYVATIKGLSLIREAVTEKLQEEENFDIVGNHLLGRSFSLWDHFLQDTFMERTKIIINNQIAISCYECTNGMQEVYQDMENDRFNEIVSSYTWNESESDLAPNLGWVTHHQRQLWEGGTLGIKAFALTPKVQRICFGVDGKLSSLLEDVSHLKRQDEPQTEPWNREQLSVILDGSEKERNDLTLDLKTISSHLIEECCKSFMSLSDHLETTLLSLEKCGDESVATTFSKLVFLGHLCNGLTRLCPHLIECLLPKNPDRFSRQLSSGSSSTTKEDQLWQSLKTRFLHLCDQSFSIWSKKKIEELAKKFDGALVLNSGRGILQALLQWDKVEIQEESEEGNTVKSVLRIPQQVSVPLHGAIFMFCWELNRIGAHSLSSAVRSEIQEQYVQQMLIVYQEKVEEPWPEEIYSSHLVQTQSLQCLFDVQFLMGLMGNSGKNSDKMFPFSKEVIAKLVSRIDPFDMDVFSSHIQSNLRKAIQQSLLLLGLATSSEQVSHLNSLKTSPPSGQIDHSLMLIPSASSRLPLLPFASRPKTTATMLTGSQESMRSVSIIPQASPLKTSHSHSSSPNLNSSENPANMMKSSSFYDRVTAMSNSWFNN